jgi:hypothetical protein
LRTDLSESSRHVRSIIRVIKLRDEREGNYDKGVEEKTRERKREEFRR